MTGFPTVVQCSSTSVAVYPYPNLNKFLRQMLLHHMHVCPTHPPNSSSSSVASARHLLLRSGSIPPRVWASKSSPASQTQTKSKTKNTARTTRKAPVKSKSASESRRASKSQQEEEQDEEDEETEYDWDSDAEYQRPPWSQVMLISPHFVEQETAKFRGGLFKKLVQDDLCRDTRDFVVKICTTVFNHFLREYTGALLVDPFAEMNEILDDIDIDDGPEVARQALLWAQDHLEDDWNEWCSKTKTKL